jgi:hypothetical protein
MSNISDLAYDLLVNRRRMSKHLGTYNAHSNLEVDTTKLEVSKVFKKHAEIICKTLKSLDSNERERCLREIDEVLGNFYRNLGKTDQSSKQKN